MHDGDQDSIIVDGISQLVHIQIAVFVNADIDSLEALLFQLAESFQHRRMLHLGSDDSVTSSLSGIGYTEDCHVVSLCTAGSEVNITLLTVHSLEHLLARFFDSLFGSNPQAV